MKRNKTKDDNGFDAWGGYMNAKISKLEEQYDEDASNCFKKSNLFAGVSIFVNGLTDPSSDELKRIMLTHGGVYHTYQKSNTTFVIANNLPDVKIRQITNLTTSKILNPQWIVDCLKEERILDYSKYLLYSSKSNQRTILDFQSKSICDDSKVKIDGGDQAVEDIVENNTNEIDMPMSKALEFLNKRVQDSNSMLTANESDFQLKSDRKADRILNAEGVQNRDGKQLARSAVDSNFLSEFYNNSRLHHISTLGAKFKDYISELREKHDGCYTGREALLSLKSNESSNASVPSYQSTIMHIDMDSFFVSVGLRSRPQLRGFPVAVTHSKEKSPFKEITLTSDIRVKTGSESIYGEHSTRVTPKNVPLQGATNVNSTDSLSEIASCSYEARKVGLKNGMFVGKALSLCPNLKTIPYDFDQYKEVAFTLYDTIARYTLDIEAVSCDEMYVDLADVLRSTGIDVMEFVSFVRDEIKTKTGCPCSAGIGANRLQARMATKRAKPNGQFELKPNEVEDYFLDIEISELPGVGYATTQKLNQLNWKFCSDLRQISLHRLQQEVGKKFGTTLHQYCRGIDTKSLVFGHVRKSVSTEVNYGIRFTEQSELETFLKQLCTEVQSRLTEIKRRGKSITLKYMVRAVEAPVETAKFMGHGLCDNVTKTVTLNDFTDDIDVIVRTVLSIKVQLNVAPSELRGIGIHIGKLDSDDNHKKPNMLKSLFDKVAERQLHEKPTTPSLPINKDDENEQNAEPISNTRVLRRYTEQGKKAFEKPARGRGRRRGGGGMAPRITTRSANGIKTASNLFKNVKERQVESEMGNVYDELDMNVLAELPDEIQEEVLREHKASTKRNKRTDVVSKKKKENEIDAEFLAALPPDIRKEVLQQQRACSKITERLTKTSPVSETKTSVNSTSEKVKPIPQTEEQPRKTLSEGNIFATKDWRNVINDWLSSTDDPLKNDIEIFAKYGCELIDVNLLDQLYLALRVLFRLISEKNCCGWHSAYFQIVNIIQQTMLSTYKSKLQVKSGFNCDCVQ